MPDHAEFASYGPWIAGTFVVPDARGRGTGSALMQHAVGQAKRWGIERLYLYTSSAEPFYAALGWRTFAHAEYENEDNTVMSLDL